VNRATATLMATMRTNASKSTRPTANPIFQTADLPLAQVNTTEDASANTLTASKTEIASSIGYVFLKVIIPLANPGAQR
jgi:hypothetical protein